MATCPIQLKKPNPKHQTRDLILLIDNYDSFTWNLADLLKRQYPEVVVVRNDALSLKEIKDIKPRGIVLSPGPGRPENSEICIDLVESMAESIPILGVCLGHQLIASRFGAEIIEAEVPVHGKTSAIFHDSKGLFAGMENPFNAMRYHSLLVKNQVFNKDVEISAQTLEGEVMAIRHKIYNLAGVQFHPESILTSQGSTILSNWVQSLDRIK